MKTERVFHLEKDDILGLILEKLNLLDQLDKVTIVFTTDDNGRFNGVKLTVTEEKEVK